MHVLFPLLLFTYPLVLHLGVYYSHLDVVLIYLAILLSLPILGSLLRKTKPGIWKIIAAGIACSLLLLENVNDQQVVMLIPFGVNLLMLWVFASTLGRGNVPLITRFASLMRENMPPAVVVYTRWATIAWSGYFLLMSILLLFFAIYAPIEVWSFFSNILSYFLLAMMFLIEFTFRRLFLRKYMDYSFTEFLLRLRQVDFRRVLNVGPYKS